jgi:hypothetical protein
MNNTILNYRLNFKFLTTRFHEVNCNFLNSNKCLYFKSPVPFKTIFFQLMVFIYEDESVRVVVSTANLVNPLFISQYLPLIYKLERLSQASFSAWSNVFGSRVQVQLPEGSKKMLHSGGLLPYLQMLDEA